MDHIYVIDLVQGHVDDSLQGGDDWPGFLKVETFLCPIKINLIKVLNGCNGDTDPL